MRLIQWGTMAGTTSDPHDEKHPPGVPGEASVTLRGRVGKIIPSPANDGSTAEILIEDSEPLYREIRIENLLQDANGNVVLLQPDLEVEITIKVRVEAEELPANNEDRARRKSA